MVGASMPDSPIFDPDDVARDDGLLAGAIERLGPIFDLWFRPEIRGLDRVPEGPALIVGNHNGGSLSADAFTLGIELYRAMGIESVPYGLAHDMVVSLPLMRRIVALGIVRASTEMAHAVFGARRKVLVYPGGEQDTLRPWSERDRIVFAGRKGYIRLALRERVPLVPVVVAGAHEVFMVLGGGEFLANVLMTKRLFRVKTWPLTLSLPWGLTPGPPPVFLPFPVRMLGEFLAPIEFDRWGPEAAEDEAYVRRCDDLVRARMQAALTRLANERRATGRYTLFGRGKKR